ISKYDKSRNNARSNLTRMHRNLKNKIETAIGGSIPTPPTHLSPKPNPNHSPTSPPVSLPKTAFPPPKQSSPILPPQCLPRTLHFLPRLTTPSSLYTHSSLSFS